MKLKSLLFVIGACLCAGASAQTLPAAQAGAKAGFPGVNASFVGGGALRPAMAGNAITSVFKPLEIVKGADKVMRADPGTRRARLAWNAKPAMTRAGGEGKLALDSVVGYNTDGTKSTLQSFEYNDKGRNTRRENSYYNAVTGWWDLAEEYGYEWTDDGLVLDEWFKGYGMGTRKTYVYDDRGRGIEQVSYDIGTDGGWVPSIKGEYEYDDRDNITGERIYTWDGSQWQWVSKAVSEYDGKNRQTYVESYSWDGSQWVGSMKHYYEWTDKPNPTPVDEADSMRITLSLDMTWDNGEWKPYLMYVQKFDNPDGYITMQETCWWNGRNWGGEDGSTSVALWEYDEHNATTHETGYMCVKDSTEWVKSFDVDYNWTYDGDGGREGSYETVYYRYDDDFNPAGQSDGGRCDEAWNKYNQLTWRRDDSYEEKNGYDENDNLTYEAQWILDNGTRTPDVENNFTYDGDGNVVYQLSRNGGDGGGVVTPLGSPATRGKDVEPGDLEGWVNFSQFTYAYKNGTRYEKLGYRWIDGQWIPNEGQTVDFDYDHPAESLITPVGWDDDYKIDVIYDRVGDGTTEWQTANNLYYWTESVPTGISDTAADGDVKIRVAGDMATVSGGRGGISVYNAGGACVRSTADGSLSLSGLPGGLYILKSGKSVVKTVRI